MSEKIALVVGTNTHWAPFYFRYEQILNENNIKYDLILWNRENIEENVKATNVFECKLVDKPNNKDAKKIWKFFVFGHFVKKIIKQNKYKKILFIGTYGCAINYCSFYLRKKYKNKIWIDVRDDLYEWFKPFYLTEKIGIDVSYATTISSHEFETFLPKHNYFYMHNIDSNYKWMIENFNHTEDNDGKIRISFIGNVRYYEQNKRLLTLLGNDNRFKLQYYGNGSKTLEDYCKKNNILNVEFYGAFQQKDTIKFYEKTDIINNMYGNETLNLRVALSNKLYYGLFLELPILVSHDTYMEKLVNEYNIGYTFHEDETFADNLYNWYCEMKNSTNSPRFHDLWKRFLNEDSDSIEKLKHFLGIIK